MNQNTVFILVLLLTALTTFILRAAPTLIPRRWLAAPLLQTLNRFLPLCVMVALILTTFTKYQLTDGPAISAQGLALVVVLFSYIRFKNVLLSMIVGVGSLNGLLYLFGAL